MPCINDIVSLYLLQRLQDGLVQRRPLIFIGHSFGGLVIEHAIVQANSGGGRYAYLVKLTGGVLLLGTPHQGSKLQKWGSIIANLANLMDHGEPGLMNEVDEKSMRIFDLVSEFKRIMISTDLAKTAVICFYENRPTDYLSRVSKAGQWLQKQTSSMVRISESYFSALEQQLTIRVGRRRGICGATWISEHRPGLGSLKTEQVSKRTRWQLCICFLASVQDCGDSARTYPQSSERSVRFIPMSLSDSS